MLAISIRKMPETGEKFVRLWSWIVGFSKSVVVLGCNEALRQVTDLPAFVCVSLVRLRAWAPPGLCLGSIDAVTFRATSALSTFDFRVAGILPSRA